MKLYAIALLTLTTIVAQADLLIPGTRDTKKIANLTCFVDQNENGNIAQNETFYQASADGSTIVDLRKKISYSVASAVVTKLPDGMLAKIKISAVARGVVFAGGGTQSLTIETDYLVRRRWNSIVTVNTKTFYDEDSDSQMMDCALGAEAQPAPTAR